MEYQLYVRSNSAGIRNQNNVSLENFEKKSFRFNYLVVWECLRVKWWNLSSYVLGDNLKTFLFF